MIPTMMSSTTTVKSAGGPVGIQQQPQSSSLRLIRLEVINQHKGIEGVGVGEQLKVVHLRISDTGVEIIEEGQAQLEEALARNEIDENTINSKGKRLTSLNVPLHIVQEETTRPSMAARTSTGSSNSSTTTINDDGLIEICYTLSKFPCNWVMNLSKTKQGRRRKLKPSTTKRLFHRRP